MEFEHHLSFDTIEELKSTLQNGNKHLSNLVVDTAIKNINTLKKEIPVVSIISKEDDLVYEVIIEFSDMIKTLEQNLTIMEDYEDYERCQLIVDSLNTLRLQ